MPAQWQASNPNLSDNTLWEIYTLEEDLDHRGAGQSLEAMLPHTAAEKAAREAVDPVAWEHRLVNMREMQLEAFRPE